MSNVKKKKNHQSSTLVHKHYYCQHILIFFFALEIVLINRNDPLEMEFAILAPKYYWDGTVIQSEFYQSFTKLTYHSFNHLPTVLHMVTINGHIQRVKTGSGSNKFGYIIPFLKTRSARSFKFNGDSPCDIWAWLVYCVHMFMSVLLINTQYSWSHIPTAYSCPLSKP